MGNYVYALRSPRLVRTAYITLEESLRPEFGANWLAARVGSMCYLLKPHFVHQELDRFSWMAADRLEKLWDGKERPIYFAYTEADQRMRLQIGQNVYRMKWKGPIPFTYNDGAEQIEKIGVIHHLAPAGEPTQFGLR